jgi:hypothetical protein
MSDSLPAAEEAMRRGDWGEARELFEAALRSGESGPAWEGLGWAACWPTPEGADHGWLALLECNFALNVEGDPELGLSLAAHAAELGRNLGGPSGRPPRDGGGGSGAPG